MNKKLEKEMKVKIKTKSKPMKRYVIFLTTYVWLRLVFNHIRNIEGEDDHSPVSKRKVVFKFCKNMKKNEKVHTFMHCNAQNIFDVGEIKEILQSLIIMKI